MSRICVKNIGLKSTEKQLKDLFGTKGEVTDVRIVRTKSGKSRQLAFIGFRTDVQAQEAIRYFNKTFIETSRVTVEEAKKIGDTELLENARSRHTKKKLEKQAKTQEKVKDKTAQQMTAGAVSKGKVAVPSKGTKNAVSTETTGTTLMSKEKRDFMEVMKHKKDKNFWANDESLQSTEAMMDIEEEEEDTPNEGNEDESDGNEESEDDDDDINDLSHRSSAKGTHKPTAKAKTATAAAPTTKGKTATAVGKSNGQGNSDMDYLRSKVRAHFSDSDSDEDKVEDEDEKDDGDDEKMEEEEDEEEEEEEDIEEEEDNNINDDDNKSKEKDSDDVEANIDDDDTGRLFVRNLIFSCAEEELRALFEPFGPLASIHLPLDIEKKGKGFGFVQYVIPEHATRARLEVDGSSFQGRLLHVMPAKKAPEPPPEDALKIKDKGGGRLSTFQQKKEDERRAQAGAKDGWNASFVRSDAVVESLAERYGVTRSAILDKGEAGGELAVRLAIGEAQIIQENRDFFQSHGVDLSALESTHTHQSSNGSKTNPSSSSSAAGTKRSDTTMLIKNLPHDVVEAELDTMFGRFGSIAALLIPKSKSVALVDFVEPSEARAAFKGLAYRKYHHVPLYLEWAPLGTIDKDKAKTALANKHKSDPTNDGNDGSSSISGGKKGGRDNEQQDDAEEYSTLFVKNLKFTTDEDRLRRHIEDSLGRGAKSGLRTVTISKKRQSVDSDVWQSMGFGFAEFQSAHDAEIALQKLQGSLLDGHALEVKPSEKRLTGPPPSTKHSNSNNNTTTKAKSKLSALTSNKLIVRNLAFQATKTELKGLFAAFGAVQRVRIPKKMGGVHRGFAFIDFSTSQEAATAMAALTSAHLYGRHLVIEYAKDDEEVNDLDQLRKRAKVDEKSIQTEKKRRLLTDMTGDFDAGSGDPGQDDM